MLIRTAECFFFQGFFTGFHFKTILFWRINIRCSKCEWIRSFLQLGYIINKLRQLQAWNKAKKPNGQLSLIGLWRQIKWLTECNAPLTIPLMNINQQYSTHLGYRIKRKWSWVIFMLCTSFSLVQFNFVLSKTTEFRHQPLHITSVYSTRI